MVDKQEFINFIKESHPDPDSVYGNLRVFDQMVNLATNFANKNIRENYDKGYTKGWNSGFKEGKKETIKEIRKSLMSDGDLQFRFYEGDIGYRDEILQIKAAKIQREKTKEAIDKLNEEDIKKEVTLEEMKVLIEAEFDWMPPNFCIIENDTIIIEQEYEMEEWEKNSDDCYDVARGNGEMIIEKFPMLEITEYYCHRNKYSIVHLKLIK